MLTEERKTSVRRLKAAEDIATARAKDAADRYAQCLASPESTKAEQLAALAASIKFHEEAAAACARLVEALQADKPKEGES
jgi:hypothetical protein